MAIADERLDEAVASWKAFAEESPRRIVARSLLKRDLNMYRGLGITDAVELTRRLVEDRSVATLEMTMGYLYERLVEELGPRKVTRDERRTPAFHGLDFIQTTPDELRLINLKAGLSTSNADISQSTIANLTNAAEYWRSHAQPDDNPLRQRVREVIMVRAVARGPRRNTLTDAGIRWLVGEALWTFLDAGPRFLERLGEALGRNPLDYVRHQAEKEAASTRALEYLRQGGFVSGSGAIDWDGLTAGFS